MICHIERYFRRETLSDPVHARLPARLRFSPLRALSLPIMIPVNFPLGRNCGLRVVSRNKLLCYAHKLRTIVFATFTDSFVLIINSFFFLNRRFDINYILNNNIILSRTMSRYLQVSHTWDCLQIPSVLHAYHMRPLKRIHRTMKLSQYVVVSRMRISRDMLTIGRISPWTREKKV